ncbi:hypothetical protein Aperf_G00000021918 [Anoplocephala perfoliata]
MTHLSGSNSPNLKEASCEANFESVVFSSIIDILREGESLQTSEEDTIEQLSVNAIEFPNHLSDEESDILSQSSSVTTPTNSTEHITTAELERLVQVSELRMKEYLAFLKEKDDKLKGAVATGNQSGKLFVHVSPTPMEVDDEPEVSASTSKEKEEADPAEEAHEASHNEKS